MANRQSLTMQAAGLPRNSSRKDWPLPVLKQILTESIQETPRQLLARELWCGSGSASEWWSFQAGYTSSTAAMSMVPTPTSSPALQATCAVPTGSMHSTNSCKQYLPCKPHMLIPSGSMHSSTLAAVHAQWAAGAGIRCLFCTLCKRQRQNHTSSV